LISFETKNVKMKTLKIIILLALPFIFACGSGGEESQESKYDYYISIGDQTAGTNKDSEVSFISDGVADETEFKIEEVKLMMWGFDSQKEQGIMTLKGKSFDAEIIADESYSGTATIDKVEEAGENPIGLDYDVSGKFKGNNGEKGAFCVSTFEITD
jgi:hypothetical protein